MLENLLLNKTSAKTKWHEIMKKHFSKIINFDQVSKLPFSRIMKKIKTYKS